MDQSLIDDVLRAGGFDDADGRFDVAGTDPVLPTRFHAGEVAAVALGLTARAAANLWTARGGAYQDVSLDIRDVAADLLGPWVQELDADVEAGRRQPPVTGIYATRDARWLQLHGGYPHLARGTLELLGADKDADAIARAVEQWDSAALEQALADADLCGAIVRSADEWRGHEQCAAIVSSPVVTISRVTDSPPVALRAGARPLGGVRVLDCTRVLAGPTSARTLAAHGAEVLHVRAAHLEFVEAFVMHTGAGKRNAFLDLRTGTDAARMRELLAGADIVTNSYRPGALDALGFGPQELCAAHPGLVYVTLSCYGSAGPWATRRGWEQHAQAATGISHAQSGLVLESPAMLEGSPRGDRPEPIPAAFSDFTTGFLAAYGAIEALRRRQSEGGSWHVDVSLCRTAMWLQGLGADLDPGTASGVDARESMIELDSQWGPLRIPGPGVEMSLTPPHWERAPAFLGTSEPVWVAGEH